MYSSRYRQGPPATMIVLAAVVMVFGGYLLWTGFMNWVDEGSQGARLVQQTRVSGASATAEAFYNRPTLALFPSITPIPACEYFTVRGPDAAFVRECPSSECKDVSFVNPDVSVCVVGRGDDPQYNRASEWLKVILEPDSVLPDIYYMHQSVLRAVNPTPTRTPTFEPLPTITRTPRPTSTPSIEPPTVDPDAASPTPVITPSITPTAPPSATSVQVDI